MNIGDIVRVKTWDAMVQEYGLHKDGHIVFSPKESFLPMMRQYCNKKSEIDGHSFNSLTGDTLGYYLKNCSTWLFPEESLIKLK